MTGEFEKQINQHRRTEFAYIDKENKVKRQQVGVSFVTVNIIRQIVEEAKKEFPCIDCMDIDTSTSPCQLELVKWWKKWFGK